MFNHAIIDDFRLEQEQIPPVNFRFVDPSEITVRTKKPKWTWVARVCHEIPVGKCVLFPVPEGMDIQKFMYNMRSALSHGHTMMDKFSIRRSKFEDYVVVMKSGQWASIYREMEAA